MFPGARSASLALAARLAAAAALGMATACVAPAVAGSQSPGADARVLVKLAGPSVDATAIEAEAARETGFAVRYAGPVGGAWHLLRLHCPDAAACDAAIARLRAANGTFLAVEPDGRKRPSLK